MESLLPTVSFLLSPNPSFFKKSDTIVHRLVSSNNSVAPPVLSPLSLMVGRVTRNVRYMESGVGGQVCPSTWSGMAVATLGLACGAARS